MRNAKEEFLAETDWLNRTIKCAIVEFSEGEATKCTLCIGYDTDAWTLFLESIDRNYGRGGQEVRGTVWFEDGTWLERRVSANYEEWVHKESPDIPKALL